MSNNRTIVLIDMDCFYVQVEQRLNPSLKGKPCVVSQYNAYRGGSIIAVSYEARAFGVNRQMRGEDAQRKCPEIQLVHVPEVRGKADLTRYRDASAEIFEVIKQFASLLERASIDEAFIDLTNEVESRLNSRSADEILASLEPLYDNSFVCGFDSGGISPKESVDNWIKSISEEDLTSTLRLIVAGCLAQEIRSAIAEQTGFRCSAGISYNKVLAKLACGLHKPNKQTIIPPSSVPELFKAVSITSVRNLGGKLGTTLTKNMKLSTMSDIRDLSLTDLNHNFGEKTAQWLYQLSRGVDHDLVVPRQIAQSIGCSKNFPGKSALDTRDKVKYWIVQLTTEIVERLEKDRETNNRTAKSLTVSLRLNQDLLQSYSRTAGIGRYDVEMLSKSALALLSEFNRAPANQSTWSPPIVGISIAAGKFQPICTPNAGCDIKKLISNMPNCGPKSGNNKSCTTPRSISKSQKNRHSTGKSILSYFKSTPANEKNVDLDIPSKLVVSDSTCHESEVADPTSELSRHSSFFMNILGSKSEFSSVADDPGNSHQQSNDSSTKDAPELIRHDPSDADVLDETKSFQSESDVNTKKTDKLSDSPKSSFFLSAFQSQPIDSKILTPPNPDSTPGDSELGGASADIYCGYGEPCSSKSLISRQYSEVDYQVCQQCGDRVLAWQMPEHSDFHFAQQLQKEFNTASAPIKSDKIVSATKSASTVKRRGRPTKSVATKSSKLTIDRFFTKA